MARRRLAKVSVGLVLAAAGAGSRLGGQRKQFRLLRGKPLFVQSALPFEAEDRVKSITVVAPEDDIEEVVSMCSLYGLRKVESVIAGGETRQESIAKGLKTIKETIDIVLTHDAVRPFVMEREVTALIEAAARQGAAVLAAPVSDTMCREYDDKVIERVGRDHIYRLFTPQGFQREILENGHKKAREEGLEFTDEVTLVRATGQEVTIVPGSPINLKITTQQDWDLAERLWVSWDERHWMR